MLEWYKNKQILVTGGAGFIGSHLAEALAGAGAKVRVLDDLSAGALYNLQDFEQDIETVIGDVRDESTVVDALRGIDVIFHLAANASVPYSVEEPGNDFSRNAWGTLNVLNAARNQTVESIVVASSGAVYGQPEKFPIVESERIQPISPYGAGKGAAESICHAFNASYKLPIKIARIFNTYGPRQPRFVMYDFYRKLRRNPERLEILGNGRQIRDYCFVADTVDALMRLGHLQSDGTDFFNISSGQSHSVVDVANTLVHIMNLENVEFCFTGESWAGDAQRWEVSIDKLVNATGYQPNYNLSTGLQQFVAWFDAHPERIVT